jgi:type IV pilus assembly protein PilE
MKFRQPERTLQCLTRPLQCLPIGRAAPLTLPDNIAVPVHTRQTGLTLVELLIVMVIVAVLAAIAYPSYQGQVRKGSRAAAQSLLVHIANRQAQYILDARNYAVGPGALAALEVTLPSEVAAFYTIVIENASGGTGPSTPPSFTLRAMPISGKRQEADGELRLTHDGAKSRAGSPGW